MSDPIKTTEAFEIWPLGMSGDPGVGITISLPENPNRVWLCWDETVGLHAWLTQLLEAEKCLTP